MSEQKPITRDNSSFAPIAEPKHIPATAPVFPKLMHDRNGAPYYEGTQTADGHVIDRTKVTPPIQEKSNIDRNATAADINESQSEASKRKYTSAASGEKGNE
jgi:hypothetical protein